MKSKPLQDMSTDELVRTFAEIALRQDDAILGDNVRAANRYFDRINDVEAVLKARRGDERRALLRLYDHPNAHVRLRAAKATLAVEPERARDMLESIANSSEFQAGDAGMALWALDEGIYKPS